MGDAHPIVVEVELKVDRSASAPLTVDGVTEELGTGWMVVRLEQRLAPKARCRIRFPEGEERIRPRTLWGTVREVQGGAAAGFHVSIDFDWPLDHLSP